MLEEHVFDLIPGYALGILDDPELLMVARHLPGCGRCRNELNIYLNTVNQLGFAVPILTPPVDLKARVLQRVSENSLMSQQHLHSTPLESANQPTILERIRSMFGGRSMFGQGIGLALGLVAILLLLFFGISNYQLGQRVKDLESRIPAGNMQVVKLEGTANAPQAVGYLMVFSNDPYGALAVENTPQLDAGHQYQIWLIRNGKRTSGGIFSVNESGYGTLQINADHPLDTYQSFGITVEPAGGSPGPTGKKVLGGDL